MVLISAPQGDIKAAKSNNMTHKLATYVTREMEGAKDLPNNSEPTKETPYREKTKRDIDPHTLKPIVDMETHMDLKRGGRHPENPGKHQGLMSQPHGAQEQRNLETPTILDATLPIKLFDMLKVECRAFSKVAILGRI